MIRFYTFFLHDFTVLEKRENTGIKKFEEIMMAMIMIVMVLVILIAVVITVVK